VTTQVRDWGDCRQEGDRQGGGGAAQPCASSPPADRPAFKAAVSSENAPSDLPRDDGPAMNIERGEVVAEVARYVGEARRIEERKDLGYLRPTDAASPGTVQPVRVHDEAVYFSGVHEPIEDQRSSRSSETHLSASTPADTGSPALPAPGSGADAGRFRTRSPGRRPGRRLRDTLRGGGASRRVTKSSRVSKSPTPAFEKGAFELEAQLVGRRSCRSRAAVPPGRRAEMVVISRAWRLIRDRPAGTQVDGH